MIDTTVREALEAAEAASGVRVHEYAQLPTSALVFSHELLKSCATNVCGHYNKSWTCPPLAAPLEEQQKKILSYKNAFVFTTKHDLEDSFDYEGMELGAKLHTGLTLEFRNKLKEILTINAKDSFTVPVYGAGSCPICKDRDGKESCAFPSACPFPEQRISSIEAAGIYVTEMSKAAGIAYNNGPNTVTYFSMALLA